MRTRWARILGVVAVAGVGFAGAWSALVLRPASPPVLLQLPTAPVPVDASRIQTGRLPVERMPEAVTETLETHTSELVHTREILESKQARITGTCPPGAAIRVVGEDGSVVCQRIPRGAVSVAALAGVTRAPGTSTAQASVPGGVGRYQTSGADDFLILPISLPDGAVVTGFSYTFWDDDPDVDGGAYLYRSDDVMMARLATSGARDEVRQVRTESIEQAARIDNAAFGYMVFLQLSARAGQNLMPISASVSYRLP